VDTTDTPEEKAQTRDRLLSLECTRSELGGLSSSTMKTLVKTGRLSTVRLGRRIFVKESALVKFIASLAERPVTAEEMARCAPLRKNPRREPSAKPKKTPRKPRGSKRAKR